MCSECWQTPCHPRCPNAPEPPVFAKCENCRTEIYEGEEYYHIGKHKFCVDCVDEGRETAE